MEGGTKRSEAGMGSPVGAGLRGWGFIPQAVGASESF